MKIYIQLHLKNTYSSQRYEQPRNPTVFYPDKLTRQADRFVNVRNARFRITICKILALHCIGKG